MQAEGKKRQDPTQKSFSQKETRAKDPMTVQEHFDSQNNEIKKGERIPTFTIEKRERDEAGTQKREKRERPKPPKEDMPATKELEETAEETKENSDTDPSTQVDEEYKEEDEDFFLAQMEQNPSAGRNQVSKREYAFGPYSEAVKPKPKILMVAEKPSIAKSIADALSNGKYSQGGGKMPVYTYTGSFKSHSQCEIKVTSVAGHVFNRDFPSKFQDRRADPEMLFEAPTLRKLEK